VPASELVAALLVFVICVGGLLILPRVWRGWFAEDGAGFRGSRRTHGEIPFFWWPYGEASRRDAIRGLVAAICAAWALLVAGVVAVLSAHVSGRGVHVLHAVSLIFIGIFVVFLILHFTVMLLNKPKFIVPPSQRAEPGVLAERSSRRRDTRAGPRGRSGCGGA
jgi:hypothetical protein